MKPKKQWPSEAAMVASFTEASKHRGLKVYPESGGHDLLLVGDVLIAPGDRGVRWRGGEDYTYSDSVVVAVEAKLRCSFEVLYQAIPPWRRNEDYYLGIEGIASPGDETPKNLHPSADFYAILVPSPTPEFLSVASMCGLKVIAWPCVETYYEPRERELVFREEFQNPFMPRLQPPELLVETPAGVPSPRVVTQWKIDAVKLCLRLVSGETLTTRDFATTACYPSTFVQGGWMVPSGKVGRHTLYVLGKQSPNRRVTRPDLCYPEIVAALAKKDAEERA